MPQELLTSWSKRSSALMTNEKLPPKLLLQVSDPCAYGRLTDVQPLGSADKTSGRNDFEKRPCEFNIHAYISHKLSSVALSLFRLLV